MIYGLRKAVFVLRMSYILAVARVIFALWRVIFALPRELRIITCSMFGIPRFGFASL